MTTPHDVLESAVEALSALPQTEIYVGRVPDTVPVIPGTSPAQIKPYIVIWPGEAEDPAELDLAQQGRGIEWSFRLTIAARDAVEVMAVASFVRTILHRRDGPGGSRIEHVPTGAIARDDPDPDLKPSRSFLPMLFGATTPH